MLARVMLVVAALLLLGVGPAPAKPKTRDLGQLPFLVSDGRRYVAFERGDWIQVSDTRERRSFAIESPEDCARTGDVTLGGGQLLWTCAVRGSEGPPEYGQESYFPMVADLQNKEVRVAAGAEEILQRQGWRDQHGQEVQATFVGIGNRWLRVKTSGRDEESDSLVDWRTGEIRDTPDSDRDSHINLDAADGFTVYCDPLKRRADPNHDPGEFGLRSDPFLPKPIWGWTALQADGLPPGKLYLERCHRRKRRLLTSAAYSYGLTPRASWWTTQRRLVIRVHKSKRILRYPFGEGFFVHQTDTRLYLQQRPDGPPQHGDTYSTYALKLPAK